MFDTIRRAPRLLAAISASLLMISCGGDNGPAPAPTPLFARMYVLGASTTDNGNACNLTPDYCTPSPPYATPRYSNGPLFNELLAARYGLSSTPSRFGGTNYAYSGARTGAIAGTTQTVPNMTVQLEQYLAAVGYKSDSQYLYVIDGVTFGNDITDALTLAAQATSEDAARKVLADVTTNAVVNMVTIITRLYASGARHVLVVNSTDVGRTPLAKAADMLSPGAALAATAMSLQFNAALAQQVAAIRASSPGFNLYLLDIGELTALVAANPGAYGFTNATDACFNELLPAPTPCSTPDTYFYWDSHHPTSTASNLMYQRAVTLLPK